MNNKKKQVKKTAIKTNRLDKNKSFKLNRMAMFTICSILVVVVGIVMGVYFGTRWLVITLKYKQYTDKMNEYGYNVLYNNSKATATQYVQNDELVRVVIGTLNNTTDINKLYYIQAESQENDKWLEYAKSLNLIPNTSKDSANRIDTAMYVAKVADVFLDLETQEIKLKMKESKLNNYTKEQIDNISKAVMLGIIKNSNAGLSTKRITKGELNKFLITIVDEYATVHYKSNITDKNGNLVDINIVTNKKDKPSNYKEYPYIVDNIEKEVYEAEYKVTMQSRFESPKATYQKIGYLYSQIDDRFTNYFNVILNVDYNNITTQTFLNSIANHITYKLAEDDVNDYVKYVKDNKIKLEGKATPLLPIIYNNGNQYVVRCKIEFNILSSITNKNILFGDKDVEYNSKEIVMYADVLTGTTLNADSLRVYVSCLADNLCIPNSNIIVGK